MQIIKPLLPGLLLICCPLVLQANTIHVPSQQPTIQAGIDVAATGDTVLVDDGIYTGNGNHDIDFFGKAIVVMSENGPESCIIDCEGVGRGFYFHSGEQPSSVVQGFTIQNGSSNEGGGINCENYSSPSILANRIIRNTAQYGGGIHCKFHSSAIISGNIIIENTANDFGGGIRCSNSSVTITKNLIVANSAYSQNFGGGGIYLNNSNTMIVDGNTLSDNLATNKGSGIYNNGGSPIITNTILWNDVDDEIFVRSGNPQVTYSDIEDGWPGEGNIDDDPLFVNPNNSNYHLTIDSPCIDAGDPNSPPDPDGTRVEIGAYYFDQSLITIAVVSDTTYYHRGEILDFIVHVTNKTDTTVFFQGWTEGETPWGLVITPLIEPIDAFLEPNQTISPHISHQIPWKTPFGGPYIYRVMVGIYPDSVYAKDSFEFAVVPHGADRVDQQDRDKEVLEDDSW